MTKVSVKARGSIEGRKKGIPKEEVGVPLKHLYGNIFVDYREHMLKTKQLTHRLPNNSL